MSGLDEAREYASKALLFRGAASIRRMRLEAAIRGLLLATAKPLRTKRSARGDPLLTRPERQPGAIDVECPYCLSMPKEWCGEYDNSANLVLWKPPKFHSARTRLIEKFELRREGKT